MRKSTYLDIVCGLLFACIPVFMSGQSLETGPSQVLRGEVLNDFNEEPLIAVIVQLFMEQDTLHTITDSIGHFAFEEVPVGRVSMQFNLLGFKPGNLTGVLVESGKESVVQISLVPISTELETIVVQEDRYSDKPQAAFSLITTEQINRYPSNFFDPGRFVTQFPGWINDHDGGNSISVRGASPAFFQWRFEGVEMVNPNHTANAGTFGDRSTPGAGGINMLSAEATSSANTFRGAETDIRFSNSLSGTMDMKYRKGNTTHLEKMVRVGLIGLEAALEGPLKEGSEASYLIHYRYSFVGLLGALGVSFGGEDIRFQDLSFNLNLPTENAGTFSIFGLGGTSSNAFIGDPESEETPLEKDFQVIDFHSRTGMVGLKHWGRVGQSGSWNTRLGISALESDRFSDTASDTIPFQILEADSLQERKLFASTYLNWGDLDDDFFKVGISYLQRQSNSTGLIDRYRSEAVNYLIDSNYDLSLNLIRAFGSWTKTFGSQWECYIGFNIAYYPEGDEFNPELRVYAQYQTLDHFHTWKAGYQSFSQLPPAEAYATFGANPPEKRIVFPLMKTESISLDYYWMLPDNMRFYAGIYHNLYYNLPQSVDPKYGFSAFNQLERIRVDPSAVSDEGEGRTFGLDLGLRKELSVEWFYLVSASVFRSLYTNAKGIEFPSQFDRKFSFSGTLGREWLKVLDEGRTRILGASIRPVLTGGLRIAPIDEVASAASGITIFDYSDGYIDQLPAYFRIDFQFSVNWNKPGLSQRLSVDIQNLTNQQNLAFYYFDQVQAKVVERYQLGLIPVLSYRLSF
ncbi:MAG: TonB-dependent receptor [Saprospiraceae bacterium]|nr:TonB-dependent receptor [Saprospiraceae bacterium]